MKKLILAIVVMLFTAASSFAQKESKEEPLLNARGSAQAYLAEDNIIYLYDGNAVAYIESANDNYHIYGFNGKHLGWLKSGTVYDNEGHLVGGLSSSSNLVAPIEPFKGMKRITPFKRMKEIAPTQPWFSSTSSSISLETLLKAGVS
jgi:hypothetical protein